MKKYIIRGGKKLFGEVEIQPAKNSVVALIAASIVAKNGVFIESCPQINDVKMMTKILKSLGAEVRFSKCGLFINCDKLNSSVMPQSVAAEIRASFFAVGALVARFGYAEICQPGGCAIGERPVDIHINGLRKLGVAVEKDGKVMRFYAKKLVGAEIELKYPSVGATENIMIAATLAEGKTVIKNCAKEPEIKDLERFLNLLGAKVYGAGTDEITIFGCEKLVGGFSYKPISDRIEAGTFLLAALCCGGEVAVKGADIQNILPLMEKLKNNACKLYLYNDIIYIIVDNRAIGYGSIVTAPFPGFPTDLQPLIAAAAAVADGTTVIRETVFEARYKYTEELRKLGARLKLDKNVLTVDGTFLHGASVTSPDLRGGASLCLAGLAADGVTEIKSACQIERGYCRFDEKVRSLGADIILKN